jgi:hypothetical protein
MRGCWRAAVAGAFIMAMAGCGDPATSRLPVGAQAIAVQPNKEIDGVFVDDTGDSWYVKLTLGTHLTVVDDTADSDRDWGTRKVLVHVEDGEHRGKTGKVYRNDLHPLN